MRGDNRILDLAVIIPAYNEAKRIGVCIDSIHAALEHAEVADAEVIVVDDESSDDTSDVARAHGAGASFRIDEMNSVTCNGRAGVSNTMASPGVRSRRRISSSRSTIRPWRPSCPARP